MLFNFWYVSANKLIPQRQTIPAWITFCMGGVEVTIGEAASIFVDVLWSRSQGADAEAKEILDNMQDDILNREVRICTHPIKLKFTDLFTANPCGCVWCNQVSVPPKLNPFVYDEDSDVESVSGEDSDDSDNSDDESSSDSESSSDKSFVPSDSSDVPTDSEGSSMEVDPLDEDELGILTARNARKWCKRWLSTPNSQTLAMTRWRDDLQNYHFCTEVAEVSYKAIILIYSNYVFEAAESSMGERQEAAVTALREMRAVQKKYYDNNSWRRRVKV